MILKAISLRRPVGSKVLLASAYSASCQAASNALSHEAERFSVETVIRKDHRLAPRRPRNLLTIQV